MSGEAWTGVAVAGVTAAYALCSRRLASTPVSSAMVFTGCGVLLGPAVLGVIEPAGHTGPILTLLESALALVLFTDAMAVRRRDLHSGGFLPARLLGIGLPLTIGAGWLLAWPLLPGLTVWELALVGAVLAPTDAALGKTAMSSPRLPPLVRQGLNVESGLNDGMVLPFFLLFLAGIPGSSAAGEGAVGVFWRALVLSTALGLLAGAGGGRLLCSARARGWVTPEWAQLFVPAVATVAYCLAVVTDGSGFIAAWAAGFAFGHALRHDTHRPADATASGTAPAASGTGPAGAPPGQDAHPADFAEHLGGLLTSVSLLVFGAVLLGPTLEDLSWRVVGYAVLSLTLVRMLPVALALAGSGLRPPTVAYIGWFGPRGLASVVLGLLVVEEQVHGAGLLGRVVAATVGLSVVLHGVSAVALADRYGRWHERAAASGRKLREAMPVQEPAPRRIVAR
ncbi:MULTISPECIES: cation:proton antiporter [unclassified Streptomyces]|uniref:cation:proton antiporter domain-containing protein n=1 Tax=unclassified Streptomyces TaxID=2593676 RepID=UPI001F0459C1|nr:MULTISPECIES: cation:proton antiporter [unclassified Streptomyces]MCH0563003.1 cation:proton antiporter [Streptomyces sp. MUM 2J]MCH0571963.1 cation:proton antiporter [Streptomyces sp. MUM 136J]